VTGVRFTTKYGRSSGLIIFIRFVPETDSLALIDLASQALQA
jgi:hypothetical protein